MTDSQSFIGYRHLYTGSDVGARGSQGFQTVAQTPELAEHRATLESLVESYKPPNNHPFRTLQLQKLKGASGYSVLSWLEPRGKMPDGRAGNFWAESLVVPSDWLVLAHWDLDAVVTALEPHWLGPQVLPTINQWPHPLAPLELPEISHESLQRLALIPQKIPTESLRPLVRAVVRMFHSRSAIAVVSSPEYSAQTLEKIVRLLPLLLPPSRRYAQGDEGLRTLRIHTRDRMSRQAPRADIWGIPHEARDADAFTGLLLDLDRRAVVAPPPDNYGANYSNWLLEILENSDWSRLEAVYSETPDPEIIDPVEHFEPPNLTPTPAANSTGHHLESSETTERVVWTPKMVFPTATNELFDKAFKRRKLAWTARDDAEKIMEDLKEQFRKDLEQLTKTFEIQLADMSREHRTKLETLEREASRTSSDLRAEIDNVSNKLKDEKTSLLNQLIAQRDRSKKQLQDAANRYKEGIASEARSHTETLSREADSWQKRMADTAQGLGGTIRDQAAIQQNLLHKSQEQPLQVSSSLSSEASGHESRDETRSASWRSLNTRETRKLVAIGALLVSVVGAVYFGLSWLSDNGQDDTKQASRSGSDTASIDSSGQTFGTSRTIEKQVTKIQEQLLEKRYFSPLLDRARERQDLNGSVSYIAFANKSLGELGPWIETPIQGQVAYDEGCLLIQAATSIGIDGQCGGGSQNKAKELAEQLRTNTASGSSAEGVAAFADNARTILRDKLELLEGCQIGWAPLTFSRECRLSGAGLHQLIGWGKSIKAAKVVTSRGIPAPIQELQQADLDSEAENQLENHRRLLFRIAHRYCTEPQDLGADASAPSPIGQITMTEAILEQMSECLEDLSKPAA